MKKIILLVIIFSTLLFADRVLEIQKADAPYTVGPTSSYLLDKENKFTLEDIQKMDFKEYTKNIPNFGFLSPPYWFKFQLKYSELMAQKEWWLNIDYPLLDYVALYVFDSQGNLVKHRVSGDLNPNAKSDLHQNSILFKLPNVPDETYTLYLKVNTSSSMLVPMYIMSNESLVEHVHVTQTLSGMYYGILIILILYNSITFAYTREKVYAFYVIFVSAYAIWQLSFDGLGVLYFWGDSYWMREKATSLFIYTGTFTFLLFSQSLLHAKENIPKYNIYILQPLKYLTLIGMIGAILLPYKYTIILGALLSMAVPATLFIAGLMVLKKDYYSIRLFVLGWGVFLVGTILFAMSKFNLIEGYLIMKYGQQIASAIEMTLLSGALVQRFNRLRAEYTEKLKSHNNDLKNQVKIALKHERHQDQVLIEQSRLASMGEMIEQIAHQWRQPLNNIGLINQDLYFKNILGTLKDDDFHKLRTQIDENLIYMSNTIDDFRTYYKGNKEKELYYLDSSIGIILSILEATLKYHKISISLNLQENIQIYSIKNELFQVLINIINNAKDILLSREIKEKQISINLHSENNFAYIEIEDNAGGVPVDIIPKIFDLYFTTKVGNKGTGIGLYMSKEMINNKMDGELTVTNTASGARFTIKLPLTDKESK